MNQVMLRVFGAEEGDEVVVDQITRLLADEEPERLEDLRAAIGKWFSSVVPGEKFTVVAEETANEEKVFVGVVRFWKTPYCDDIWLIEGLQVLKLWRQQGIGRLLAERGLEILRQRGVDRVSANIHHSNLASMRLFESLGFQKISTGSKNSYSTFNEKTNRYMLLLEENRV